MNSLPYLVGTSLLLLSLTACSDSSTSSDPAGTGGSGGTGGGEADAAGDVANDVTESNRPPELEPVGDVVAYMNMDTLIVLTASDPDGDALSFSFASSIADISARSSLKQAGTVATFSFTPIAADVGYHTIDFTVSDGVLSTKQTVAIEVRASSTDSAPVFVKPEGAGTTLNLAQNKCIEVNVEVEDPDSANVVLSQEVPLIDGAVLSPRLIHPRNGRSCPMASI